MIACAARRCWNSPSENACHTQGRAAITVRPFFMPTILRARERSARLQERRGAGVEHRYLSPPSPRQTLLIKAICFS